MLQLSVVAETIGCPMELGEKSWNPFQYRSIGGFWVYGRKVLLGIASRVDIIPPRKGLSACVDIASLHRDITD